jgi:hypothetical protein
VTKRRKRRFCGDAVGEFEAAPAPPLLNNLRNEGPHHKSASRFGPIAALSHIQHD